MSPEFIFEGFLFMSDFTPIISLILAFILLVLTVKVYYSFYPKKGDYHPVRFMARVGIFGAMSAILYAVPVFTFSVPGLFPSFLELHFDEIPAFICGFAYGPLAGIACLLIKTLVKIVTAGSSTFLIGEFCDIVLSTAYVGIATFIYRKKRNLKGVALGFGVGTVVQVILAMFLNVYVLIPAYSRMIGNDALLAMMNTGGLFNIVDVGWSYALLGVLPFNLMKDIIVIIVTFLIYRSIHTFLRFDKKKTAK